MSTMPDTAIGGFSGPAVPSGAAGLFVGTGVIRGPFEEEAFVGRKAEKGTRECAPSQRRGIAARERVRPAYARNSRERSREGSLPPARFREVGTQLRGWETPIRPSRNLRRYGKRITH